ncbi:MAG: 5'-nucleotidase [Bacteroidales bacterium]
MRKIFISLLVTFLPFILSAQIKNISWSRIAMDSTYDSTIPNLCDSLIDGYSPGIRPLMEIIIYSKTPVSRSYPEGALSNLATDIILYTAEKLVPQSHHNMIALLNFGGIREDFPKGPIRKYDVLSSFPFDNYIVVMKIKGKDIRKLLTSFANNNFQPLAGVRMEVENNKLTKISIQGSPLYDNKTYYLATVDFIYNGGDHINIKKDVFSVLKTKIAVRDAVMDYLSNLNSKGQVLNYTIDHRIIVK